MNIKLPKLLLALAFLLSPLLSGKEKKLELSNLSEGEAEKIAKYIDIVNGVAPDDLSELKGVTKNESEFHVPDDYPKVFRSRRSGEEALEVKRIYEFDGKYKIVVYAPINSEVKVNSSTSLWVASDNGFVLVQGDVSMDKSIYTLNALFPKSAGK